MGPKVLAKMAITRLGRTARQRGVRAVERGLDYLSVGEFLRRHGMVVARHVHHREELFALVTEQVEESRVLYLEFGVWQGGSMRWWSEHLTHPETELHGFDSFEGLPEAWNSDNPKGAYTAAGKIPDIADHRVQFHVGWFTDTLPGFQLPGHDRLVVNFDADLYSSTAAALDAVAAAVQPGTFFYFDELADRAHELRAFDEFLVAAGRKFKAVGVADTYTQWLFECER
jgi:hypothetical protein